MEPLTPEQIALILQEEAQAPTRTRGPKVDPTEDRTITGWYRLSPHWCTKDCHHRTDPKNPTTVIKPVGQVQDEYVFEVEKIGNACWNPDCEDHVRDKQTDRGTEIVYEVKGQQICRYCYLAGYLKDG